MRKAIGFAVAASILLLAAGCGDTAQISPTVTAEGEIKQEASGDTAADASAVLPSSGNAAVPEAGGVGEGSFYEYEVSYESYETAKTFADYESVVSAILSITGLEETDFREKVTEVNGRAFPEREAVVDGITYRVEVGMNHFRYSCDCEREAVDREEAVAMAEEFLDAAGLEVDRNYDVTEPYSGFKCLEYRFLCDGIPMMGPGSLHFSQDEDEIPLRGSFVQICCVKEGIQEIYVHPLPEIRGKLEAYDPETDFITKEKAADQAWNYKETGYKDFSTEYRLIEIEESRLIYIPYKRNGKAGTRLIPAYEVKIHTMERKGTEESEQGYCYNVLVDARSGFVLHSDISWDNGYTEQ